MIKIEDIEDSFFLKKLYPEGLSFEGYVDQVNFSHNGPSIEVSFHLAQMPVEMPSKWKGNRVCIKLLFLNVEELEFSKWERENKVNMKCVKENNRYQFVFESPTFKLYFSCECIYFRSISAYMNEE